MSTKNFCKQMPKIELHAHLNGSLSEPTLKKLGCLNEGIAEYQKLTTLLNTTEKTLSECFSLFAIAQKATSTTENLYYATRSVIQDFAADNVIYLELRTTPRNEPEMSKADYIKTVVKAIKDEALATPNILVKLLLSIDRRHDPISSGDSLKLFIEMKNQHPDIIKGVDLSGDPTRGTFDQLLFKKARDNGFLITLHCAEVDNEEEVEEMLKFCPERIGHGTAIHPNYGGSQQLWEIYLDKKIPLECCLTSNVVCGTSRDYKSHHLKEWIARGESLPFLLGTDDKGVFCTTLSKELVKATENLGLSTRDLLQMTKNAIDVTFASDDEKQELRTRIDNWKPRTEEMTRTP